MKTLIEKAAGIIARMLETMDTEQGNQDPSSAMSPDDERVGGFELNTAPHHTLIETCW